MFTAKLVAYHCTTSVDSLGMGQIWARNIWARNSTSAWQRTIGLSCKAGASKQGQGLCYWTIGARPRARRLLDQGRGWCFQAARQSGWLGACPKYEQTIYKCPEYVFYMSQTIWYECSNLGVPLLDNFGPELIDIYGPKQHKIKFTFFAYFLAQI